MAITPQSLLMWEVNVVSVIIDSFQGEAQGVSLSTALPANVFKGGVKILLAIVDILVHSVILSCCCCFQTSV